MAISGQFQSKSERSAAAQEQLEREMASKADLQREVVQCQIEQQTLLMQVKKCEIHGSAPRLPIDDQRLKCHWVLEALGPPLFCI